MNDPQADPEKQDNRVVLLSLAALGVVYGDISTSPLYAIRECFHGEYGIEPSPANILGVLSLMFWALLLIVTIKYLGFILLADNNGEGGPIALVALVSRSRRGRAAGKLGFIGLGLFAASLLYGDGMITPAISVLSAVEGMRIITPALQPFVPATTVAILLGLFVIQRRGTGGVGALFGPIVAVWLLTIGILGARSIALRPEVLAALDPSLGARFLLRNGMHGFMVLGAVFLVVTGAEALYADLGHFGRRPIRLAWLVAVLPALVCSYFGQGAILLVRPEEAHHPFYALAPQWLMLPLVILATVATVIASQAVISGAFSLTHQAIQLGYLPRLRIIHTSATERGQVFIPQINWLLMAATITLVLGFGTSSKLAAAYGMAVTTTMLISSILFYVVARNHWGWSRWKAAIPSALFIIVDVTFFGANITKITHGAWFPLSVGALAFALLTTWKRGRTILSDKLYSTNPTFQALLQHLARHAPARVPGRAVFMAGRTDRAPPALLLNLEHNKVLHEHVAILTVSNEEVPRVPREDKVQVTTLGNGFYQVQARYGFMEQPNVPHVLAIAAEQGVEFVPEETSFFIGRESLVPDRHPLMPVWQERIFAFLSRNAMGATDFFHLPADRVIELGTRIKI